MYTRQEASAIREEFWTAFGRYMRPVLSAEGEKINWINYKTGQKNIQFRMYTGNRDAFIGIVLTHADPEMQQLVFEQLEALAPQLASFLGEKWRWQLHHTDERGKITSRIFTEQTGASVFKKEDWPMLITFFKPRLMALDAFWCSFKYGFEGTG